MSNETPTDGRLLDMEEAKRRPRKRRKPPPEARHVAVLLPPGMDLLSWDDGWFVEVARPIVVEIPEDCLGPITGNGE